MSPEFELCLKAACQIIELGNALSCHLDLILTHYSKCPSVIAFVEGMLPVFTIISHYRWVSVISYCFSSLARVCVINRIIHLMAHLYVHG